MKTLQKFLDSKPLSYWISIIDLSEKKELSDTQNQTMAEFFVNVMNTWQEETGGTFPANDNVKSGKILDELAMTINIYINVRRGHMKATKPFSFLENGQSFSLTELGRTHVEKNILTR